MPRRGQRRHEVFGAAVRTYSKLRLAEKHPTVHNLVISNVPGPDFPLYFLGAKITAMYPMGPVFHGAGLNLTATVAFDSFRNHPLWLRDEKRRGLSIKATNCEADTPARSRMSTKQWMALGDAARVAQGDHWDTSASDMITDL